MSDWTKAYVKMGALGVFPAEVATLTSWNGAVCPRFTRQVAQQVVEAVAQANRRANYEDSEFLAWDGDVITCHVPVAECELERIEPDQDGMYVIGWQKWSWSEVWCQGDVHIGEPDDLAAPVAIVKQVEPDSLALLDQVCCSTCLEQARALRPGATVTRLPPL
jgi:hypothetical protein